MNKQSIPPTIKIWLTALRLFSYTASLIPVLLGLAIAAYLDFPIKWGLFVLTLIGVISFQVAANLLNDCFDYKRGLDRIVVPTSGAIVRGWLTERQVFSAAMVALTIGIACGITLTILCGWMILALGLAGTFLTLGYTRSGICFKYHAMGDIVIFITFGMLPVFGTFWVQTQTFSILPLLWSIPMCFYTVGILHANNWRDLSTDKKANCKTLAGALGSTGSQRYYRTLILSPYIITVALASASILLTNTYAPLTAVLSLLSLPLAIKLTKTTPMETPDLDGKTAQLHLAFGILLTIGIFAGKFI